MTRLEKRKPRSPSLTMEVLIARLRRERFPSKETPRLPPDSPICNRLRRDPLAILHRRRSRARATLARFPLGSDDEREGPPFLFFEWRERPPPIESQRHRELGRRPQRSKRSRVRRKPTFVACFSLSRVDFRAVLEPSSKRSKAPCTGTSVVARLSPSHAEAPESFRDRDGGRCLGETQASVASKVPSRRRCRHVCEGSSELSASDGLVSQGDGSARTMRGGGRSRASGCVRSNSSGEIEIVSPRTWTRRTKGASGSFERVLVTTARSPVSSSTKVPGGNGLNASKRRRSPGSSPFACGRSRKTWNASAGDRRRL